MRNNAHELLPTYSAAPASTRAAGPDSVDVDAPIPKEPESCAAILAETRAALVETRRQRDSLKAAIGAISAASTAAASTLALLKI